MVTATQVAEYLGVAAGTDVSALLAAAEAMIAREIGDAEVPVEVVDNATLALTGELHLRASNPGGVVSYAGGDTVVRVTRDPMTAIRPLLAAWVVPL